MVPLVRIGLTTPPLPRECSTTEPQRRTFFHLYFLLRALSRCFFRRFKNILPCHTTVVLPCFERRQSKVAMYNQTTAPTHFFCVSTFTHLFCLFSALNFGICLCVFDFMRLILIKSTRPFRPRYAIRQFLSSRSECRIVVR